MTNLEQLADGGTGTGAIPESTNKKFQVIIITLSNGKKVRATVPAFCKEGDELHIVNFQATPPEELPPDARWGKLID